MILKNYSITHDLKNVDKYQFKVIIYFDPKKDVLWHFKNLSIEISSTDNCFEKKNCVVRIEVYAYKPMQSFVFKF